jgi:hypothetical protein
MEQLLNFLYGSWFKVLLVVWLGWMATSLGKEWFKEQFGWVKSFFEEEVTKKASSRRAIEVAVVWVFLVGYLKVTLSTSTLQDIPWGWGFVIAGILGLKTWDTLVKSRNGSKTNGSNK